MFLAGILVLLVPFYVWTHSSQAFTEAFRIMYSRGSLGSFVSKVVQEVLWHYADFLGLGTSRLGLGESLPYRVPLVIAAIVGLMVLFLRRKNVFVILSIFIAVAILWFAYAVTKNIRYFTAISPFLCIALGIAFSILVAEIRKVKWV
jgi:hypothetical protein